MTEAQSGRLYGRLMAKAEQAEAAMREAANVVRGPYQNSERGAALAKAKVELDAALRELERYAGLVGWRHTGG